MQTVIGMILLGLYHPWLLAFDVVLVAVILFVVFPLGNNAVTTAVEESKAKYALVAWLQETARHHTLFLDPAAGTHATRRANDLVTSYLNRRSAHFRILLRQILGTFGVHAIASASLLAAGGWLVMQRQLTLGQLVAAEIVVELVLSGFTKLGKHLELYYDLCAAVDKLGYLQDLPLEPEGREPLPVLSRPAAVSLDAVEFGFDGRPPLISEASVEIRPGEKVAIAGPSGAGKSTLLELLFGMRQPRSGVILVDGADIRHLRRDQLRGQTAMVDSAAVFEGTVAENVRAGRNLEASQIRDALVSAGVIDAVLALPDGLDTQLATGGLPLSSGQAAGIAIARAIAGNPRLLLVDEILDHHTDSPGFAEVAAALFSPTAPWTLVIATASSRLLALASSEYWILNRSLVRQR